MITSFNNGPFTVTRTAAGAYNASTGEFTPGATSALSVNGSIQQLNARERLLLPDGLRAKETLKLYTDTLLRTDNEGDQTKADSLVYGAFTYEVVGVENWNPTDIPHYKVILLKRDANAGTRS